MARTTRPRALAALLLTLGVLWAVTLGSAAAGAQAEAAEPSTTVTVSVPVAADELARTGPRDDAAGLGVFGFAMVGVGVITIVASRRLLTSEGHRR